MDTKEYELIPHIKELNLKPDDKFLLCSDGLTDYVSPDEIGMTVKENLMENSMDILADLELPHRLLQLCSGDISIGKYNSHDLECRMPSRNAYGETHSVTAFLDFQARRLNLKYRDKDGKIQYCYTMNNTAIATPRVLIAIIENNQTADGKIRIPKVLQPYMGKEVIG